MEIYSGHEHYSLFLRTLLQEVILYSVKELETCINSHTIFSL